MSATDDTPADIERLRHALGALDASERLAQLCRMLSQNEDVSLLCLLLQDEAQARALLGDDADDMRSAIRTRIEALASTAALWRQAHPAALLWFWWRVGEEARVYAFVGAAMADAQSLPALLAALVEKGSDGTDQIAVRRWSKIVDFAKLEPAALKLAMDGETREARRRARRLLEAFGNGKSELFR